MMIKSQDKWHIDKSISITLIILFLTQAVAGLWWVSSESSTINSNTRRIENIETQRIGERLAALESQMQDSKGSLLRIESKIDRIMEDKRK